MNRKCFIEQMIFLFILLYNMFHLYKCRSLNKSKAIKQQQENCTNLQVDVRLASKGGALDDGIVQVTLPDSNIHHPVCYPTNNFYSHRQAAMFAHVLCRQLGHMTYATRYQQSIISVEDLAPWSLQAGSFKCTGHEQTLSQCKVQIDNFDRCNYIMAVLCTTCHSIIQASEGVITNPGYPHAYFYTVLCEWTVVVPEEHDINLVFNQFTLPQSQHASVFCNGPEPYIEITYGLQDSFSTHRFCIFNFVKTFKVPYTVVKVKFFSGIYSGALEDVDKKYGFNILFRAEPADSSSQLIKIVIIAAGFIVFFVLVISCYCCRKWNTQETSHQEPTRAVSRPSGPPQPDRDGCFYNEAMFPRCGRHPGSSNTVPQRHDSSSTSMSWSATRSSETSCEEIHNLPKQGVRIYPPPTTPYTTIPQESNRGTSLHDSNSKTSKLRTKILSKLFSLSSERSNKSNRVESGKSSQSSEFEMQGINFNIYQSFTPPSLESSYECQNRTRKDVTCTSIRKRSSSFEDSIVPPVMDLRKTQHTSHTPTLKNIPAIVIELVDNDVITQQ